MKFGAPRLVEQCDVLCGSVLIHLRVLFDGEDHSFDLHKLQLTRWRIVSKSAPAVRLTQERARGLAEEQACISCGVARLQFKWKSPTSAPRATVPS
jgi:hypothetical protein